MRHSVLAVVSIGLLVGAASCRKTESGPESAAGRPVAPAASEPAEQTAKPAPPAAAISPATEPVAPPAGRAAERVEPTTSSQATGPGAGGVFHDLRFDEACAQAGREGKVVMVDFYTTWCVPCKKLDKETWTDEAVRRWLQDKTIALRIDAEKQKELAKRYRIDSYPTMVFMKPDGAELGRIVGFKEPKSFLTLAGDALAGRDPTERIRAELKSAGGNDPGKRMRLGDELARQGKQAEALEEYLWCFDHGLEHDSSYFGVRLSFLLADIVRLGQSYPPALAALRERRDATLSAFLEGKAGEYAAMDIASLNRELKEPGRTLELYDQLKRAGDQDAHRAAGRRMLFGELLDTLMEARRYQDVVEDAGDIAADVQQEIDSYQFAVVMFKDKADSPVKSLRDQVVGKGGQYYEALLGVKKTNLAEQVSDQLLTFDGRGATYAKLIGHAIRAGDYGAARELAKRGQKDAAEEERAEIEEAAREIP